MRYQTSSKVIGLCLGVLCVHASADNLHGKLYWSANTQIQCANLDGSGFAVVRQGFAGSAGGIDIDLMRGQIYWTSVSGYSILRANLDGSGAIYTVPVGAAGGYAVRIDSAAGKLYFDLRDNGIYRCNLDGTAFEVLFRPGVACWGFDIDYQAGKIYWGTGYGGALYRANLDGSERQLLYQASLGGPSFDIPRVRLDVAGGKIYWPSDHDILRANLDGTGVETLVSNQGNCVGIDLDVAAGKMYWTDNLLRTINRANLDGSGVEALLTPPGFSPNPLDVRVLPIPEPMTAGAFGLLLLVLRRPR